jgi:6-phosphogluconolactonase
MTSINHSVERYDTLEAAALALAEWMVDLAQQSITERGWFSLALSGGSTPKTLYRLLGKSYAERIDWQKVHIFWSDERCVPPNSTESNYRMANETLLSIVPEANIHRIKGELAPEMGSEDARANLAEFFEGQPRFDLILLGMGDDGHTASLFPNTQALTVLDKSVIENFVPQLNTWRITFTYSTINQARQVAILVSETNKQARLEQALTDPSTNLPIQGVKPSQGVLRWFIAK